jgi:hypothetical protein
VLDECTLRQKERCYYREECSDNKDLFLLVSCNDAFFSAWILSNGRVICE